MGNKSDKYKEFTDQTESQPERQYTIEERYNYYYNYYDNYYRNFPDYPRSQRPPEPPRMVEDYVVVQSSIETQFTIDEIYNYYYNYYYDYYMKNPDHSYLQRVPEPEKANSPSLPMAPQLIKTGHTAKAIDNYYYHYYLSKICIEEK